MEKRAAFCRVFSLVIFSVVFVIRKVSEVTLLLLCLIQRLRAAHGARTGHVGRVALLLTLFEVAFFVVGILVHLLGLGQVVHHWPELVNQRRKERSELCFVHLL